MNIYLEKTNMLDYQQLAIQQLIQNRNWRNLSERDQIQQVYDFVRNEIKFGYNSGDDICASKVLADGYGQCNTKSTLLMALLRALGIPCRIHGFYIDKRMQKGALTGIIYRFAPNKIVHAWTEVYFEGEWLALEGVIIDDPYLQQVKNKLCQVDNAFVGYGVAVNDKDRVSVCWNGNSTYIQSASITDDLGVFDCPDDFFRKYNNTKNKGKQMLFNLLRKRINKRLESIRKG